MSKMKEKMHIGELYLPGDEEIIKEQVIYQDKLCDYNLTKPSETEKRIHMLKEMLGDCGEGVYIEAPFYANFGGHHCHFGNMVYANYHLTCVDDTHIYIGDYTMIGPNVTIATAGHPILPELREKLYQYNMPVHIGRNCWIGAGAIILPGVTVGDNTVIGAGSIVTKDIPANVVAVGNPCRVLREINEHDKKYYFKDREIKIKNESSENNMFKYLLINDINQKRIIIRQILEALPEWFEMEEGREKYIQDASKQLCFAAYDKDKAIGFLCLKETGRDTVELAVMGVRKEYHRNGIGKNLFKLARETASKKGYSFMQVKTVQMGIYDSYDATNRFYQSLGFKEFELLSSLWDKSNPCQIYIMSLN